MGVIAVESRTVELAIPADPANPESEAKVVPCKIQNLSSCRPSCQFICPSLRLAFLKLPRIQFHITLWSPAKGHLCGIGHAHTRCRGRIFAQRLIGVLIQGDP